MIIRRGKHIDSRRLKSSLDKSGSIRDAAAFSRTIPKGEMLAECPICRNKSATDIVEIYGFLYRECQGCGTAFVANPPTEDHLRAAYRSDYYTSANKILLANDEIIGYRVTEIANPKVAFVREHATTRKSTWLDVGCGVGEILSAAKGHGFDVFGLDANPMESEYARRTFGVAVSDKYVSELPLDMYAGQYGVISLFSVLEHVISPNTILGNISRIQHLGDNLVLEVPHYPSISVASQISFPDQVNRMMHPPLHLFLFPLPALQGMLKKFGYEIRAAWFFGQDFYEMFSTLGLFNKNLHGSALQAAIAPLVDDFQKVVDEHQLSDEVLIVAEKTREAVTNEG